ncbi:hypothetical protein OE88DRAFT_1674826 [Heliocybe sulcata]|uniref:Uncharacterized protein n=1 Tax=Heliocybe sulcata TaxID=5364 RepID=A0A5C3NGK1_9AGAM|nr:hypothetical protein OE88DRAFT_1674826 [Heliocybe sulcata]
MALPLRGASRSTVLRSRYIPRQQLTCYPSCRRTLFNLFRKPQVKAKEPAPILSQDNLFHPLSKSPFPPVRVRAEAIKKLAACPVCAAEHSHLHAHTKAQPKAVSFECPDCGWPTHCSEEHWDQDEEHAKYCGRLREVNEDEHDLRSGRKIREFELPGPQDSETAISFANWDVFWYTRGFPSMDTERSRRHASKLLTYPITIGSVLHEHSYLTLNNQRLTPEGSRSLAALRTTLHVPPGAPETEEASATKPEVRIFILGARAESSLPAHVWEQLHMLFPAAILHIFFVGPQVSLPDFAKSKKNMKNPKYVPNIYNPPTPPPIPVQKFTRQSIDRYNVPSYTTPYNHQLTITGMQANYVDVHAQFQETFDPYTDCFFLFNPGFGFPSPYSTDDAGNALLQIASPTEWGPVVPLLLATKCPIFVTGFSPADVERDVRSLSTAPGVAGEFDWVVTPGPNAFGSEKWEVNDFDPRVMLKLNWGIWGIRGQRRDIREKSSFSSIFS